jgi:hypothetical protein
VLGVLVGTVRNATMSVRLPAGLTGAEAAAAEQVAVHAASVGAVPSV